MRHPLSYPLAAIIQAEMRFNLQRPAPWALFALFSFNAWLWWGAASVHFGWASNSDFYIMRLFGGLSFLTAPFFTALLMGDAVARDFRLGVHPLLLSAPVSRAEYLLGKFGGNFLTLVLCLAGFALTLFLLQWARTEGMIVLPWRATPYLKHFVTFTVVSHLAVAALCFAVGALWRSAKLVYGLIIVLYAFYIAFFATLAHYAPRLVAPLDPFLFDWINRIGQSQPASVLNQTTIAYNFALLTNRAAMICAAVGCLALLYWRFTGEERRAKPSATTLLELNEPAELLYQTDVAAEQFADLEFDPADHTLPLPKVTVSLDGPRARWQQFAAAVGAEFRLLRGERSLVAITPLVVLFCCLQLSPRGATPDAVAYATGSAEALLLLLFGVTLFYVGETMQRDQELRLTPLLWSAPAPDAVLLLAKFAAAFLLALAFTLAVALSALALQLYRLPASVALRPYLVIYTIILLPSLAVMIGATITLHVLLRDKYLAHAAGLALGGGLIYLFLQGYTHWAYNPALFGRWHYADLSGSAPFHNGIILQRGYWLALTLAGLAAAHRFFPRCGTRGRRWAPLLTVVALIAALVLGVLVGQSPLSGPLVR